MADYKSDFLNIVVDRGYLHQCTDLAELDDLASRETVPAYIGFDCTAPSLHVGNLVSIMLLRHLQKCGHKPIVLMGGGTSQIGDPSGKDESRQLMTSDKIAENMERIKGSFQKFMAFGDGATDALMVDNAQWLRDLEYISFLREYGRHFTVNRMLTFDSVRLRLEREQPLSFLEFNYMILQAYDFLELNRRYGCKLQMGGSDQWGNIVNGVELTRRADGETVHGLTTPLIMTATGSKMGKTAKGAVWLNPDMCSPWDYWQYWRNTDDADVGRFLRLFTDLPLDEIARLESLEGAEINEAKKILATEATRLCHGDEEAQKAADAARETFEKGGLAADLPTITIGLAELQNGLGIIEALRMADLATSNGEARRLIRGGGARINNHQVEDEDARLSLDDVDKDGFIKISAGKKRHVLLRPE